MYSTHGKGNSAATEKFARIFKNKLWRYITSISKNVYIDKLADIGNGYNNSYYSTIKMKPGYLKSSTYIDFVV